MISKRSMRHKIERMKKYLMIVGLFMTSHLIFAQEDGRSKINDEGFKKDVIKPLKIGDTVPDIEFDNVLNYKSSKVRLSDFKGKLLILDFWATWCAPCIGAFPKLDSIQNEFGNKIQILSVTQESESTINAFFAQMKKLNKKTPTSIVGDNILSRLFKHTYLPHYVWIDGSGKVIAITEGGDITRANIKTAIEGQSFAYKLKNDGITIVDETDKGIPIISAGIRITDNGQTQFKKVSDSLLFVQSTLTQAIEGMPPGTSVDSSMVGVWNAPIIWLYKVALWKHGLSMLSEQKTIAEISNSDLYELITASTQEGKRVVNPGLEYQAWLKDNGYCYQLKVPKVLVSQKYDIMLEELNRFFGAKYGIEGHLEKRSAPCLALERTSTNEKFASKNPDAPKNADVTKFSLHITNLRIGTLTAYLGQPLQEQPMLIDETGFKGKIDVKINCDLSDINALNTELAKYDLRIVKKTVIQDIAVIRVKGEGIKAKL